MNPILCSTNTDMGCILGSIFTNSYAAKSRCIIYHIMPWQTTSCEDIDELTMRSCNLFVASDNTTMAKHFSNPSHCTFTKNYGTKSCAGRRDPTKLKLQPIQGSTVTLPLGIGAYLHSKFLMEGVDRPDVMM